MTVPPRAARRLWRHLWYWVVGALLTVWATLVGVAYYTGVHEAEEITDGQLVSIAELLMRQPVLRTPDLAGGERAGAAAGRHPAANGYAPRVRAVVWQGEAVVWDSHGLAAQLPAPLGPGHHTLVLTVDGEPRTWRWLVAVQGDRRVAVAIDTARHRALGRDIAEHVVRPALVLLPLLALLLAWAIRRGLAPLSRLAHAIDRLDFNAGQTLPAEPRFVELASVVQAINALVARLQQLWQRERRFTSDVAHELRTPLTALVWQARVAREQAGTADGNAALASLEQQAMRAGHILTQLLELARAQTPDAAGLGPVDLCALARQVAAEHVALAHQSGHELAVLAPDDPIHVEGRAPLLGLAVRNLIDNALRHTPAGTQVEVRVERTSDGVRVAVLDDGARPGGAPPVQGAAGLGIGLTLVQRIADMHGAALRRDRAVAPWTTAYTLHWPASCGGGAVT